MILLAKTLTTACCRPSPIYIKNLAGLAAEADRSAGKIYGYK